MKKARKHKYHQFLKVIINYKNQNSILTKKFYSTYSDPRLAISLLIVCMRVVPPEVCPTLWLPVRHSVIPSLWCRPTCRHLCSASPSCSDHHLGHHSCAQLLLVWNILIQHRHQTCTTKTFKYYNRL